MLIYFQIICNSLCLFHILLPSLVPYFVVKHSYHTSMFPWEDFPSKKCPGLQQTPWVSAILLLDELLAGNLEGNKRWSWGWFVPDYAITITEYPSLSEHILAPHHPLQTSQCKHAHAALCHIVLRILEISMPPVGGRLERRNGNTFDHANLNYLIRPLIRDNGGEKSHARKTKSTNKP